jgi:hypothetical protein
MCKDVFLASITQVKARCSIVIDMIITKLHRHFVDSELMYFLALHIHNFGCNLMLISLSPCILMSSRDTIVN